jgi:outer membrane lipoprotein-sorting protein
MTGGRKGEGDRMLRLCCVLRLTTGFWLACVVVACAASPTRPLPLPVSASPMEVLATLRRQEDTIHSLRARFSATLRHGGTARRAEGVLLIKKPDRFRLRLLSPFGFTVFDYVADGTHARMELPLEGKQLVDDEITTQSTFSPLDFRQAFLRGEAAFPGRCTPGAAGAEVVVDCRTDRNVRLREIRIVRVTGTVTRETSFDSEQTHAVLQFDDYRIIDGLPVPFAIELRSPERDVTVQITLRTYEINPVLADALFEVAGAAGPAS